MTVRHHIRGDKPPLRGASYGRLRTTHTSQEDIDVLPPPCDRMDRHDPDPLAPCEQAPRHGAGAVESGHGPGTLVCPDRRQGVPGPVAGPQRAYWAPAVARVLLRSCGQPRHRTLCSPWRALLYALAGLGRALVAGHPIGPGPRGDHLGEPLYRLGAQRGLPRLCTKTRSEEHTSELQSRGHLVCRLLLEK